MKPEIVEYASEAEWLAHRAVDVTSTESAALFGMSPYVTRFELWHRKKTGAAPEFKENERMKWGSRLESAIAYGIAEDKGWKVRPLKVYMRDADLRMGSSFDFLIEDDGSGQPALLEIKNVDSLAFKRGWIEHDDGTLEAPEHIEVQVQHQMAVSGYRRAYIGALVGGNTVQVIQREADEDVIAGLRQAVSEFWRSIDEGKEPDPVMPDDAAAVIRLNQYAEPDKVVDLTGSDVMEDLLREYRHVCNERDSYKDLAEVCKAKILAHIQDAERVICGDLEIRASMVADSPPTVITAEMVGQQYGGRKGYRAFKVQQRKTKK